MTLAASVSSASPAFGSMGFLPPSTPPAYTFWKGPFTRKEPVTPEFSASVNRGFSPAFGFSMAAVADMPKTFGDYFYKAMVNLERALERWAKGDVPPQSNAYQQKRPAMAAPPYTFNSLG